MKGFCEGRAAPLGHVAVCAWLCFALAGCDAANKVLSSFDRPLNVSAPIETSPGNFSVSADDANASVANAAAIQAASSACASLGLRSQTIDSSASVVDGRHYFTLNFLCQ